MVNIITKKVKGKEYMYLIESFREGTKVKNKILKYIGAKRPVPEEEFECMKFSYSKQDWMLVEYKDELSYQEHKKMRATSNLYKKYLSKLDETSKENEKEKFLSIFISNSNAIEGSTLSVKDTYDYLFNDITPKGHKKKELFMASNMLEAWNYLEENYKRFPTHADLFRLHELVNRNIETDQTLGKYKKVQNYIANIYASSYLFVNERMKNLFRWIKKGFKKIDNFEVAFQSHAQFELIHPFVDGNGRVGRLVMNWLLMNKGLSPLAIHVNHRSDYISALNNFRKGKIEAICRFCFNEYIEQNKFVNY